MATSDRKTEALVGLFIFIGLGLLGGLIVQFGRFGDRFAGKYPLTVIFEDAAGIIKGSEVRMGGAKIGRVASVPMLTDDVKVRVELDIRDEVRIPQNSKFQIASATLLGDKLIVVTPAQDSNGAVIEPGSTIRGGGPSGLDAIQDNAVAVSRDARQLLQDAGKTLDNIDSAVDDIRTSTHELSETLRTLKTGVLSEPNLEHISSLLANLDKASANLDPTLTDTREAITSIRKAADSAQITFAEAAERIEELEPALRDVPKAVASLNRAAAKAADTLDQVNQGDGLLGTLTQDEEVSKDAKTFIRNLKEQGILRYRDTDDPPEDPRTRYRGRRR